MARPSLVQGINIAPELEREGRAGQQVQQLPDDGLADAFGGKRGVAAQLGAVASQIGTLADHAAGVEGKREGHLAGLDPEFRTRQDGTIRGEAFDKAALDTYLAKTRVEIDNDIQGAALKHQADPKGLANVLKGRESGWLQNAPAELHPEIRTLFSHGAMVAQREATRQLWTRQAAEQQGALQAELETSLRSVHQAAFAAGLDPQADQVLAGLVTRVEGALGRTGPNGQRLVAPAQAVKLIAGAKEEIATARLYGAFDRLPDVAAKAEMIKQLDADFAGSTGVAKSFDLPTFQKVKGHLESELRKSVAAAGQAGGVLQNAAKELERRAKTGEPVQEAELAALVSKAAQSTDPNLHVAVDEGVETLRFMQQFKTLPVGAMEQAVDQMRQELAASPASLLDGGRVGKRLKAAEDMLTHAQGELKRNPLAWEGRVGMTQVVPLDRVNLATPGELEAWGQQRAAQAEGVAARHGLGKPTYLQPLEQRALAKSFEQGGEKGLAAVTAVRRAFGDRAEAVLGEVGKEAPAGALLADLALKTGSTPAVLDGAEGLHMMTQPGHKRVAPSAENAKLAADAVVGTALGRSPAYLTQAMKLADAIYERRAYRDGKIEAFDERGWKQAFREALGEHEIDGRKYGGLTLTAVFGGQYVVLPPDVPQDKAGAILNAVTPDDLGGALGGGPRHRNGVPLKTQELRSATLVTLEPGKYLVALGSPQSSDPKWALDHNGQAFVLDLNAALPQIRRRRPDLR